MRSPPGAWLQTLGQAGGWISGIRAGRAFRRLTADKRIFGRILPVWAIVIGGMFPGTAAASDAEIFWALKVWGVEGEEGFITRLTSEECLCRAARVLGHSTGLACGERTEWDEQFGEVEAFLCESYEPTVSPFATGLPGVE